MTLFTDEEARRDLSEKLRFERMLADEIKALNKSIVRNTVGEYGRTGHIVDAAKMQQELAEILIEHYNRVSKPFSEQISEKLPSDIEITDAETIAIATALALFFAERASEQASIITDTNQRDINNSVTEASANGVDEEEIVQTRLDVAVLIGVILSRKLRKRVTAISSLETQTAAETAKATESQILIGLPPSVTGGTPRDTPVTKQWVTMGDERVRGAHILADHQVVSINKPFIVGGQSLRWPGDTSLGATAGNVINCRCSSVIIGDDVFAERKRRLLAQ